MDQACLGQAGKIGPKAKVEGGVWRMKLRKAGKGEPPCWLECLNLASLRLPHNLAGKEAAL